MKTAVNAFKKCEIDCQTQYKNGNQDNIASMVRSTTEKLSLPQDISVPSWKFQVEYSKKIDIFPPILQPDDTPYYRPTLANQHSNHSHSHHSSHKSKGSTASMNSLQDIIDNNLGLNDNIINVDDTRLPSPLSGGSIHSPSFQNQIMIAAQQRINNNNNNINIIINQK